MERNYKAMYAMLGNRGDRYEMILLASGGRVSKLSLLTDEEFVWLKKSLEQGVENRKDAMRKKVIAFARSLGWVNSENNKVDMDKIAGFILVRGVVKKPLNSQSVAELSQTISQFETMYNNSYASNNKSNNDKVRKAKGKHPRKKSENCGGNQQPLPFEEVTNGLCDSNGV